MQGSTGYQKYTEGYFSGSSAEVATDFKHDIPAEGTSYEGHEFAGGNYFDNNDGGESGGDSSYAKYVASYSKGEQDAGKRQADAVQMNAAGTSGGYSKYMSQYAGGQQSGGGGDYQQYMSKYTGGQQGGGGGDYQKYMSQYTGGQQGDKSAESDVNYLQISV